MVDFMCEQCGVKKGLAPMITLMKEVCEVVGLEFDENLSLVKMAEKIYERIGEWLSGGVKEVS